MLTRGWSLSIKHTPADLDKNEGQTFTARFQNRDGAFEAIETDENLAVCIAALAVIGVSLPSEFLAALHLGHQALLGFDASA